jgi:Zn-dependent M28 family amino/carboxypeptidase
MTPTAVRMWFYGCLTCALVGYVGYATWMPGASFSGPRPERSPEREALQLRLRTHVEKLAREIGARNLDEPLNLRAARDYIGEVLAPFARSPEQLRLEDVGAAGGYAQNVILDIPGTKGSSIVVVGAHYDSCGTSPGANDNGTGVAAALELAGRFSGTPAANTVRVVLFTNEEPPFFKRPGMGSRVSARNARSQGERIVAMLSLETMGYYSDSPGSQKYPWPLGLLYPSRGNFIAFVGDLGSRTLVHESIRSFREAVDFPSEGAALPSTFPGVDWSDHWAFRQEGYPAIMVTDTAVYRDPHYHQPTDTSERLDYEGLAVVTEGLERVIRRIAR